MNTKKNNSITCSACRTHLPELLLDEVHSAAHMACAAHLAECAECVAELASLRSTFALLDTWTAPEPSPYFDSKLHVRLREAEAARPESLWEHLHSFLLYSTGRHLRPAITGALALVMLLGGGTVGVMLHQPTPQASATVNDLKILDNNAQALQQMDQLLDESTPSNTNSSDDSAAPPTT